MVRGVDHETLDGLPMSWFEKTSKELMQERYKIRPVRRVYIPKENGKTRPIGISSPREKIVQQSLRLVLETVLEPKFLETSHGFRPKKGCHTALKTIRDWKGLSWYIEGDIKAYFDSIDHHLLANLLRKHFRDQRLENLYWKLVKAGFVEFIPKHKPTFNKSILGVPQGGIISPLLSNLVLHELDLFVAEIQNKRKGEFWDNGGPILASVHGRIGMINVWVEDKCEGD